MLLNEGNERMNRWTDRWRNSPSCGSYLASPAVNHSRLGADLLPTAASQFQNFFPWQSVCLLIFLIALLPFLIRCATGMTHHSVCLFPPDCYGGSGCVFKYINWVFPSLCDFSILYLVPQAFSPTLPSYVEETVPILPEATTISFVPWEGLRSSQCLQQPVQGIPLDEVHKHLGLC